METLRHKIIRLAHENPELRPHLLPLLKGAVSKRAGMSVDSSAVREITGHFEKALAKWSKQAKGTKWVFAPYSRHMKLEEYLPRFSELVGYWEEEATDSGLKVARMLNGLAKAVEKAPNRIVRYEDLYWNNRPPNPIFPKYRPKNPAKGAKALADYFVFVTKLLTRIIKSLHAFARWLDKNP